MHAWEAVQLSIDYIEAHLYEDIKIGELSQIVGLSEFYFQRLFKRLVKSPWNEYIKLRRLASSTLLLKDSSLRIIDIALNIGFKHHETFTRMFKKTYGITPEHYRKNTYHLHHFDKPNLVLNYVMVDFDTPLIADDFIIEYHKRIIDKEIRFVGVKGYYQFQSGKMLGERPGISEPDQVWKKYHNLKHEITSIKNAKTIAVSYKGDAIDGYSSYFVGLESNSVFNNIDLSEWVLPKRAYIICRFEAENFKELTTTVLGKAMKHIRFFLKAHGLRADGFFPEVYEAFNDLVPYMEMWIPYIER